MADYRAIAAQAARSNGIDPNIFVRQINQESGFNPNARSGAGAVGIAQIVMHYHPDAPGPEDPIGQLHWAAHYMAGLVREYGSMQRALSAYNSGRPDAYKDPHFAGGQTYNYVRSIMGGQTGAATPAVPAAPSAAPRPPQLNGQGAGLTPQQEQAKIRQAALGGLQSIVQGTKPTEAFGDVAGVISSLKQAARNFATGVGPTATWHTHPAAATQNPPGVSAGLPVAHGKIIGTPYQGTHAKAFNVSGGSDNWESENANDIAVPVGTPIYAVAAGIIGPQFGSLGTGGRFAGLRLHLVGAGNEWYYAHMSKFAPGIKPGVQVRAGELLGYSGEANGVAHLHIASKEGHPPT